MGRKAGCVPVRRRHDGHWEVMLVQSRWTPQVWLFPKGGVESGEFAKEAAVRETCEEAGLKGRLGPKLGTWRFAKTTDQKQKMWILFVQQEFSSSDKRWKERKKRSRCWFCFTEARTMMTSVPKDILRPELLEILSTAESILANVSGNGDNWKADLAHARRADPKAASSAAAAHCRSCDHKQACNQLSSDEDSDYRE